MRLIRYGAVWVLVAAAVLAVGGRPASATGGLIADGSFEKPAVAVGGFREFATGQGFAGWRVVGARGRVAVVSGRYLGGGITFDARTGAQWMDLTGDESNTATGVAQGFASIPGRKYHLTFWVGNVYDPGGIFGVSSAVKVYVNGVRKLTAVNSLHPVGHKQGWKRFTLAITATSGRTTISFINGDPRNDNSNGLDGVQVS